MRSGCSPSPNFKGKTWKIVVLNGIKTKEMNSNAKLLIMYATMLILLDKHEQARSILLSCGKVYYDFDLVEANI